MPLSLLPLVLFAGEPWAPPIAELAVEVQDKGVARLERCISLGEELGQWSSWQDACAEALGEHDPNRRPAGVELQARTAPRVIPQAGPVRPPEPAR